MKLTQVLRGPPVFHFWKDWGAGRKRRIPYYKYWWNRWRGPEFERMVIPDMTIKSDQLPSNARIFDALDFKDSPATSTVAEMLQSKDRPLISHPWPFNIEMDESKTRELAYSYSVSSIFYRPLEDSQVFTNTILESKKLKPRNIPDVDENQMDIIKRNYDWAMKNDGILSKLPVKRKFPFINIKPTRAIGIQKERSENSVLNMLNLTTQSILAKHYSSTLKNYSDLLSKRSIAFPHCQVPFRRDGKLIHLDLTMETLTLASSSLPLVNQDPETTQKRNIPSIAPRTWRSLLEQTQRYDSNFAFTLPNDSYPSLVQVASRVDRKYKQGEMLARCLVHLYGLGLQFTRLQTIITPKSQTVFLEDPLKCNIVHDEANGLLKTPLVLQAVAFETPKELFHFVRYQLNTAGHDPEGVKNQAWYSGPVKDLDKVVKYYLDFHAYPAQFNKSSQILENSTDEKKVTVN